MRTSRKVMLLVALPAAIALAVLRLPPVRAHCDGLDGPVVKAAQDAVARGDVTPALIWVGKRDEAEIRRAFELTLSVRKLNPQARALADTYFFETLVRVHRAAEGAPYTGLKPAGRDLGPAIPAADLALKSGTLAPLTNLLVDKVSTELRNRYQKVMAAKSYNVGDVAAGRAYVEAYVSYIHYVEAVYEAATSHASGHYPQTVPPHTK